MWTNTLPTASANADGGKESRKPEPLRRKLVSSSSAIRVSRLREMQSRLLNSINDPSTLLGFIVWGLFMSFVGIVLALASLGPTWLIIVMAIISIPFIFGACNETK